MSVSLKEFLEDNALAILDTPDDGACFFHALRMMLSLEEDVQTVRLNVVKNMDQLFGKNVESQSLLGGASVFGGSVLFDDILDTSIYSSWDDYILKMSMPFEWADTACIWSAVHLYDVKITVYVSNGNVRVFDKLPSWDLGDTKQSISLGNRDQLHYVATEAIISRVSRFPSIDPTIDTISLKEMYKRTFKEPELLDNFSWDKDALVTSLVNAFTTVSRVLVKQKQEQLVRTLEEPQSVWLPVRAFLQQLRKDNQDNNGIAMQKLKTLIDNDYRQSTLDSDEYKKGAVDYQKYAVQLLLSWFGDSSESPKMVVDQEKKGRLLRILQMAIKIGLNYQMLSVFDVKFLPKTNDLDDDDLDLYFNNKVVPKEYKKVKMSDLASNPYWEGIHVVPDMGDYVSEEALRSISTDQLVNMVKRTTLYRIHKINKDYRLNLDEATPKEINQLCELRTLRLAPVVHEEACRHFETGTSRMADAYTAWLTSNKSFKPYSKEVDDESFITVPDIPYTQETSVSEVIDDLSLLPGLIRYRKHDDHEHEIVKNGDLYLVNSPSDAPFALELSEKFVELDFLPWGYERYCGVKVGEQRSKRSVDDTVDTAERPGDI
jgi:hypothetical protein